MIPPHVSTASDAGTGWPHRLARLAGAASREQVWILLYAVVVANVRARARGVRSVGPEDVHDIAAQKTLDLMRQLDAGSWEPARATPEQIRAYVVSTARNAVVDFAKSQRIQLVPLGGDDPAGGDDRPFPTPASAATQDAAVDGKSCAAAILACLSNLTPKNRVVWYLRILLELTSQQIARHPSVRMRPGAVDVMLFRLRAAMRRCLAGRGVDPTSIPPGTFAWLWESIQGNDGIFPGEGNGR